MYIIELSREFILLFCLEPGTECTSIEFEIYFNVALLFLIHAKKKGNKFFSFKLGH